MAPSLIICVYSLLTRGAYGGVEHPFTFENFTRLFDPLYGAIFLRSLLDRRGRDGAVSGAGISAGAVHRAQSGARKNLYLSLVILPFWTSFLIRIYAWMFLLRDTGLINTVLLALGVIHDPLPMLYNDGAVILGLVYGFLPFTVLPLYATLERLDRNLLEAAADLGSRPWDDAVARDDSAVRSGNSRRGDSGVRAVPGDVSDLGSVGREQDDPDREPGAEPVHGVARLAFRRGGVAGADDRRDGAAVRGAASRRRVVMKRGLAALRGRARTRFCTCPC